MDEAAGSFTASGSCTVSQLHPEDGGPACAWIGGHLESWRPRQSKAPELIAERITREANGDEPPAAGPGLVADRIRAVHRAAVAKDALALENAIVSAASALGLWLDRLRRLRVG